MSKTYRIAPSILSANFAKLGQEIDDVITSGTDLVHFDVMDNHYVPNLTIGPLVCEAIKETAKRVGGIIDVHLMVKPVDRIIPDFAKAGANIITFHPEASEHIDRSLATVSYTHLDVYKRQFHICLLHVGREACHSLIVGQYCISIHMEKVVIPDAD